MPSVVVVNLNPRGYMHGVFNLKSWGGGCGIIEKIMHLVLLVRCFLLPWTAASSSDGHIQNGISFCHLGFNSTKIRKRKRRRRRRRRRRRNFDAL